METLIRKEAAHREFVKLADERNVALVVMEVANPKVQDYISGTTAS